MLSLTKKIIQVILSTLLTLFFGTLLQNLYFFLSRANRNLSDGTLLSIYIIIRNWMPLLILALLFLIFEKLTEQKTLVGTWLTQTLIALILILSIENSLYVLSLLRANHFSDINWNRILGEKFRSYINGPFTFPIAVSFSIAFPFANKIARRWTGTAHISRP
jgi:hypothetical protein